MQEVLLVDADSAADSADGALTPDGSDDGGRRSRGATWARRARRWWPVAAGLALIVVVGQVTADRRENARLDALADVPGVLAPLDRPVHELWRRDKAQITDRAAFAGQLLAVEEAPDGSVSVVAIDARTGKTLWRAAARGPGHQLDGTRCAWPRSPRPSDAAGTGHVIACVVVDEYAAAEPGAAFLDHPSKARMVLVDATTGAVLSDKTTAPTTSVRSLGADLVISRVDSRGYVHVTRTDALGATNRWTYTSKEPVPLDAFGQRSVRLDVADGTVVVRAFDSSTFEAAGSTWLLSGDGRLLRSAVSDATRAVGWLIPLPGGKLVAAQDVGDPAADSTTISHLTTGTSFTISGHPSVVYVNDGSVPDLLLATPEARDLLVGYDAGSGRRRWTTRETGDGQFLIIDGRILSAKADVLRAIDGRTGDPIWTTQEAPSEDSAPLTDGRLVLLAGRDPERGHVLAAYGLDDGRLRWKADLPGQLSFSTMGGKLYGSSQNLLVAFG
jgi:outer membrane protein assembly factor BamB